jgi:hypothetical protein
VYVSTIATSQKVEHFAFWLEIIFRYYFPVFFPRAHKATMGITSKLSTPSSVILGNAEVIQEEQARPRMSGLPSWTPVQVRGLALARSQTSATYTRVIRALSCARC